MVIHRGTVEINNCYLNNTSSSDGESSVIIESKTTNNNIIINNSIIENSNIKHNVPLMHFIESNVKISNTTIKNCYTQYGFLIDVDKSINENKFIIENSIFDDVGSILKGYYNLINLKNITIQNILLKNSLPVLNNCKHTKFIVENSMFKNIKTIGNGLIGPEASYIFKNVQFKNITSNAKAIFNLMYNSNTFENIIAEDLSNIGDMGDASCFYFNSGEDEKNLNFKNIYIKDGRSNGPFFKIQGYNNLVNIKNTIFSNITSYGSIINNTSKKSKVVIDDLNFNNNKNLNKLECGTIHFENSLELLIYNSTFENNSSRKNGGSICFTNSDIEVLSINSTQYILNKAENGGAIYFDSVIKENSIKPIIQLVNVTFNNNTANNCGGAIFSNNSKLYYTDIESISFKNNIAEVAGGAIYVPDHVDKKVFDISKCIFNNNKGMTYGNDYSTEVSYIKLNITDNIIIRSGDYIPLSFSLYDEYNKYIDAKYNAFSDISIRAYLSKKSINSKDSKYLLNGNICSFYNSICDLSQLRVFANNDSYFLKFEIENHNSNKVFDIANVNVTVINCDEYQIQSLKNGINVCEDPICDEKCNRQHSTCIPKYKNITINSVENNICRCNDGYNGNYCDDKILFNSRKIKKIIYITFGSLFFCILINTIFLIVNKEKRVVFETGYFKHIFFSIGIVMILFSSTFLGYMNYGSCVLFFILYHNGFLITYCVVLIHLQLNLALGTNPKEIRVINNKSDENYDKSTVTSLLQNKNKGFYDKSISINDLPENMRNYSEKKVHFSIQAENINTLFNNIRTINILYSKIYIFYILFAIFMIIIISVLGIKDKKLKEEGKENLILDGSKTFIYECPLDQYNIVLGFIEFLLFIPLISKLKKVLTYECIFKLVRNLGAVIIVWVTIGPFLNFVSNLVLQYNNKSKILLIASGNVICYTPLYCLYMYNIIYTIIKKQWDNTRYYFIYPSKDFCFEHKIYYCNCNYDSTPIEIESSIDSYLMDYNYCSKFFEISNGKIKFVSNIKKMSHKNLI
ncbi:hypothetical protein BCR36DRAFT_346535 [Piromyces finnis]|uniref:EGF-like domain-containing protein n=1 Tax=Piromyces finnis TaxID=1754191 RepID=A0A1Y1VH21_9FUNG|nr:hypothetical protein BCR36DRAFT_346535 [Piromyces finnis]|eukprot:ORX56018.1 hypothetical protein BCR36DRAFT_346535 [Piromyces finnis]